MPKASRGKGMGRGCPPPQPTRESGEHCKLTQWGQGTAPAENKFWRILELEKKTPDRHRSIIFDISAAYSQPIKQFGKIGETSRAG